MISEVTRLMWEKSAAEKSPTDTGILLGKGVGWSLKVQPRSWNMGQLLKVSLRNVFMAGRRGFFAGSSCLSKLGSIRKYFWAAQLSLRDL